MLRWPWLRQCLSRTDLHEMLITAEKTVTDYKVSYCGQRVFIPRVQDRHLLDTRLYTGDSRDSPCLLTAPVSGVSRNNDRECCDLLTQEHVMHSHLQLWCWPEKLTDRGLSPVLLRRRPGSKRRRSTLTSKHACPLRRSRWGTSWQLKSHTHTDTNLNIIKQVVLLLY